MSERNSVAVRKRRPARRAGAVLLIVSIIALAAVAGFAQTFSILNEIYYAFSPAIGLGFAILILVRTRHGRRFRWRS
ncbi:MAG: hypothetical protein JWQ39_2179 [Glaciihabitans sp.]|nr:hypothetical protein [Glaciihabitans sp.]